tara:strand:+ start:143 stop:538 length:396 start_codon:yes stop_codon:yes gene_type:complete
MSISVNADPIAIVNGVNMVVSFGLLALGIVMIVYGFRVPDKKCEGSTTTDCVTATDKDGKKISDDVEILRLVSLITGFLLIIPFGLNALEYFLAYFPNTGNVRQSIDNLSRKTNAKAYSMKSMHHNMNYDF